MLISVENRPQMFLEWSSPATSVQLAEVSDVRAVSVMFDDQIRGFDEFSRRLSVVAISRSTDHARRESRRLRVGRVLLNPIENNRKHRTDRLLRNVYGERQCLCQDIQIRGRGLFDHELGRLPALLGFGSAARNHLES